MGRLLTWPQLRRSLLIATVVCLWLTAFNQYDRLAAAVLGPVLAFRVALNFATPFTVSAVTAAWNDLRAGKTADAAAPAP